MSRIKICGLTRMEDILAANEAMPDYVGFVFAQSKRQISKAQAHGFLQHLDKSIQVVGVFVNQPEELIAEYLSEGLIDIAQLHGQETEEMISRLKERTGKPVIKAVSVRNSEDIISWQNSRADFLLLDHGMGGTGAVFPWGYLRQAGNMKKPYFLAGGLNSGNLSEALRYKPYCVDISSGAETDGKKDAKKMKLLVSITRNGGT